MRVPTIGAGMQSPALVDARESLAYWEERSRRLPPYAIRRRREARELARRWQARVAEAERQAYGRGMLGAALMLLAERRLPLPAQRLVHGLVRRTAQAVGAVVLLVTLTVLWSVVTLLDAVF